MKNFSEISSFAQFQYMAHKRIRKKFRCTFVNDVRPGKTAVQ